MRHHFKGQIHIQHQEVDENMQPQTMANQETLPKSEAKKKFWKTSLLMGN
jgi:hypothetical protein